MLIELADLLALASKCAPLTAPATVASIVQVESGRFPLAIGVNGAPRLAVKARSPQDAAAKARALIAAGRSVDLGLAQINSRNLARLGLSIEAVFEPCRNLAAAQTILQEGYARGRSRGEPEQAALRTALSVYNTGHPTRGLANGYVDKVAAAAARLTGGAPTTASVPALPPPAGAETSPPQPAPPSPPAWDVFGEVSAQFVIAPRRPHRPAPQTAGAAS